MSAVERILAASRDGKLHNRQTNQSEKHCMQNCNMGPQGDPRISSAYHWLLWFHGKM